MNDVTIIIPTIFKNDFVLNCINSIYENVKYPILILLSSGYNTFSKACNEGFENTNTEWVLFLNDDIEIKNDFVSLMLETAEKFNAVVVGAKLLYPNGNIQHIGVYYNLQKLPFHLELNKPDRKVKDSLVPAVTGACMLVKSEVFREVGGFDEGYENGFEDIDFCNKVREKGYKIALCGRTELIHYEKQSRGYDKDRFQKNIGRYIEKWLKSQKS